MRRTLTDHLACPECSGKLEMHVFSEAPDGHIEEGTLACTACPEWYAVRAGVPRMLPDSLLPAHKAFFDTHKEHLVQALGEERVRTRILRDNSLEKLQSHTVENFGNEWEHWDDFGWEADTFSDSTRRNFNYKVLFTPEELEGKLLLDAGCGNGRYSIVAREYGATVIGVDLSSADTAFRNTRNDEGIHIIQGDLFKLPLKKNHLDFAFSNGVLMHTGDARKAFLSIASHLNETGKITVHVYHKGNFLYEFNDWWLRLLGVHVLPLSWMHRMSIGAARVARMFPTRFLHYVVNAVVRLEPHPHYVFDWYTAPIATHHTYKEVYGWLDEAQLHLVEDHNATNHPWYRSLVPFWFLTVKAQRQKPDHPPRHTINTDAANARKRHPLT